MSSIRALSSTCLSLALPLLVLALPIEIRATEKKFEEFDRGNFGRSTSIDNPWYPLKPGTQFVYEGTTVEDDGEVLPHQLKVHITDLVKIIDGVESIVAWDLDFTEGELVEAELAFYAQDDDGTVWRMGEHPEEYEDGNIIDSPTWIAGIDEARPGITMLADPKVGTPSYSQGWAPSIRFTDRGQVDALGGKVEVPYGRFKDVLVIVETSEGEGPDAQQLKFYAHGSGELKVGWRGEGEKTQEVLGLVEVNQLSPSELAEARSKALMLEQSAYRISKDVYGRTEPMAHESLKTTSNPAGVNPVERAVLADAASSAEPVRMISDEQARAIALAAVPGEVVDIAVERKLGAKRIVVEVIREGDLSEIDVVIDMESGEVLATES